jgi:hypothetical protein
VHISYRECVHIYIPGQVPGRYADSQSCFILKPSHLKLSFRVFKVPFPAPILFTAEREATNRVVKLGAHYSRVRAFVERFRYVGSVGLVSEQANDYDEEIEAELDGMGAAPDVLYDVSTSLGLPL